MNFNLFKKLAFTAVMAIVMNACGGGSSTTELTDVSLVKIDVSLLGFGDSVTYEITATRTDATGSYSTGALTASTSTASVPATDAATLSNVAFGTYTFSIDVYEGGSVSFTTEFKGEDTTGDGVGDGYVVDSDEETFTLNLALGDGENLTEVVSEFYSTVNVTVNFDFPAEVTLTTTDIALEGDFDGADGDDYVAAELGNAAVKFFDYETFYELSGTTAGGDLCSAGDSSYISSVFTVKKADGSSCTVTSQVEVLYYGTSSYGQTSCGSTGGSDCCRFRAELTEADLTTASCADTTLTNYEYFVMQISGTDSIGNTASATVNVSL